jgi:hypothetical protein
MFTTDEIREIVAYMSYLDWELRVLMDGDHPYLQVFGHGPDPKQNMKDEKWSGRKFFISPHMCKNEIIRTGLLAVERAVAHEMYENILYKGFAIFTPHMDYEEIVEIMRDHSVIDSRDGGMQGV